MVKKLSVTTYEIKVSEQVKTEEKLITDKWWFNGVKRFFTVKVLPPRKK